MELQLKELVIAYFQGGNARSEGQSRVGEDLDAIRDFYQENKKDSPTAQIHRPQPRSLQ